MNSIPLGTDAEGREIVVRVGRYGPYLQRGEDRAAVPENLAPDELTVGAAAELLENPSSDRVFGKDPRYGQAGARAGGRFGPYVQLGEAADGAEQAADGVVVQDDDGRTVSARARRLQLLELPRTVGGDPETGEEIVAANGRFGPFLKRGNETRSLDSEEQLFTVTLEEALSLVRRSPSSAATALRRRRSASSATIRTRGWRSCCDRAVSGRMSPTGPRTPRCGEATTPTP